MQPNSEAEIAAVPAGIAAPCAEAEHQLALFLLPLRPPGEFAWLFGRDAASRLLSVEKYYAEFGYELGTRGSA